MKKSKSILSKILKTLLILIAAFLVFVVGKIIVLRQSAVTHIVTKNNVVENKTALPEKKITYKPVNMTAQKENSIHIVYNGKELNISDDIYKLNLRYYVNPEKVLKAMNLDVKSTGNSSFKCGNAHVDLEKQSFIINDTEHKLRGKSITINNTQYISINDIADMLNLRTHWDLKEKKIYMFTDHKNISAPAKSSNETAKVALIRFEDVSAGSGQEEDTNFEKFRILGDYLYSIGSKYNVTWIPRYKNPGKNVDNNLLTNDTFSNYEFISTLDHLIYRGATIGLHGYTHQNGDTVSAVGSEMTWRINTKESDVRAIAENALNTANTLNIPVKFFESPHYHAVRKQQKVLENYFSIMYEPYSGYWNANPIKTDKSLYVPAPIGYVKDEHGEAVTKDILKDSTFSLASVFVHPYKEFKFIKLSDIDENGYVDYTYEDNTPVKNIMKAFKQTNHQLIGVDELIK
ncbi:DUF2334 domain-containing protein [Inconstantimicrobium porci]|uniref:DUF2334 domain-containing protein n=1 Tax=Inconstantimicrobium porci TaxID=2652291 RepID=A0A7X2MVP0_9CLOT|nr:DUF2334 domain-containing protein [Inconstantimicrobium porci]MDD6770957.1 DUF2334 domain-containing protein [Inconstantimicrobium porci]MSR89952.1 DUF2334 domain-containing protein [Inconstantimicrobium porci]